MGGRQATLARTLVRRLLTMMTSFRRAKNAASGESTNPERLHRHSSPTQEPRRRLTLPSHTHETLEITMVAVNLRVVACAFDAAIQVLERRLRLSGSVIHSDIGSLYNGDSLSLQLPSPDEATKCQIV